MDYPRLYPPNAIDPDPPRADPVWIAARNEYLEGYTAERICHRHGLSLSTFRTRARREGWRRAHQEQAALETDDLEGVADITPRAALPTQEMAALAWKAMSEAIRKGRVYEARAWMRLCADETGGRARRGLDWRSPRPADLSDG